MKSFNQKEEELNEGLVYSSFTTGTALFIAKKLMTSFKNWDAYKLNLIDEKGIRTEKEAITPKEKEAINLLNTFIIQLKRLLLVFVRSESVLKILVSYYIIKNIK